MDWFLCEGRTDRSYAILDPKSQQKKTSIFVSILTLEDRNFKKFIAVSVGIIHLLRP